MGTYRPRNTDRARALRSEAPPAERQLWRYLRNRQLGVRFNRQMPIGPYFCDFLAREIGLVVELDGYSHAADHVRDETRDAFLQEQGRTVLRFTNAQVFRNIEGVVTAIAVAVEQLRSGPPPAPPASGRGDERRVPGPSGRADGGAAA